MNYNSRLIEVRRTDEFSEWLSSLKDVRAAARIQVRISRVENGNLGDARFFEEIGKLRVDYGPGYGVYFVQRGKVLIVLLCGGIKSSQRSDIRKAILMAKEV